MNNDTIQVQIEQMWKEHEEDQLIAAYVPDAENYSREDALKLALERDKEAALALADSKEPEKPDIDKMMKELGF